MPESLDLAERKRIITEKKRIITRERRAARRERRRISRRCFWTWPFGHVWDRDDVFSDWTCEACGKTQKMVWCGP